MIATVYFQNIREEIISNLRKANCNIKVAVAWLTDEDIIRTLSQKREAGLEVEIVISDSKENFKNTNKLKDFIRHGGKLFITTPKFLHHKFCIIDDSVIINGSYNWSYSARTNEENIMVFVLDKMLPEDANLISRFSAKHKFFCDKISQHILDMASLNAFRNNPRDASIALSQLDEHEITLRQEFESSVEHSFNQALAAKIPISHLLLNRMKSDGGGVDFVKRILHDEINSGDMKSGFRKLEEVIPHRVDLSLEYLVSRPKFESLFSKEEVDFCKKQMKKYNL